MVKIKKSKNGSFKITGMNCTHLEAISTLISHTRLGDGVYEGVAFELAEAFEEFEAQYKYSFSPSDCELSVSMEDDSPTINLVSVYD